MAITITEAARCDERLEQAFRRLIPQLSQRASVPSRERIERIVADASVHLLLAEDEESNEIAGMLTLAIYEIPTSSRAWIEDVVIDESRRGEGIGQKLVEAAIATARRCGAEQVNLTSNPRRTAARRLYGKCGFEQVDTTLFRLKF